MKTPRKTATSAPEILPAPLARLPAMIMFSDHRAAVCVCGLCGVYLVWIVSLEHLFKLAHESGKPSLSGHFQGLDRVLKGVLRHRLC